EWIESQHSYYMRLLQRQNRQYVVKWVAIYLPSALRQPGAVTRVAPVQTVEVLPRTQIATPWQSDRHSDELQVIYRLGAFTDLRVPIEGGGVGGESAKVWGNRWSSRLALERAHEVKELVLETEPEWRFYEDLISRGVEFEIKAGTPTLLDPDDPSGRAWF